MSLSGMRSKIDTALGTISVLNHYPTLPSVVIVPAAFVMLRATEPVTYDFSAQNATAVYHFDIHVMVNKGATLEQAQNDLDPYLQAKGAQSIKAAIEAINWLTDADTCRVMSVAEVGNATFGGDYYGARMLLDVWVTN